MMKRLVEIDTSQPFGSVKEAVTRFGGNRPSIPHHSLSQDGDHKELGTLYVDKMEEHTSQLERVLITRERETLEVLKELEDTKKLLQGLKASVSQEEGPFMATSKVKSHGGHISAQNPKSTKSMSLDSAPPLMDLDQAKVNLSKTSIDLAVIRASVESLNTKMSEDIEVPNHSDIFYTQGGRISPKQKEVIRSCPDKSWTTADKDSQFSFEADQFKKMVETSRYEVMKAMSEIEKTKVSIKMAEMRLDAARKIEEAAKAVEAIAFAERDMNGENSSHRKLQSDEITLSFKEYSTHTHKSKEAEEICKTKFIDRNGISQMRKLKQSKNVTSLESIFRNEGGGFLREEDIEDGFLGGRPNFHNIHPASGRNDYRSLPSRGEFHPVEEKNDHVYRPTTSIGDILSRKLVIRDDFVEGKRVEGQDEHQEASLSQMIREQSGQIFRHVKSMKDGRRAKHFFAEKKKFGFIHVVLPKNRNKRNKPCT